MIMRYRDGDFFIDCGALDFVFIFQFRYDFLSLRFFARNSSHDVLSFYVVYLSALLLLMCFGCMYGFV